MRATYEITPPAWGETLAVLQSVSLADGPAAVRARVVDVSGALVTIDFPALADGCTAEELLAVCIAGEWSDRGDFASCRLVGVEWPEGLPGPAFPAEPGVSVGAIVKPALGLTPEESAAVAAELAAGGAVLVKDDELMASPPYSPLAERVRAVAERLPRGVRYAPNLTGPPASLLARAETAVAAGAGALMVSAFLQGLGSIRALRDAKLGVPIFVHRVGSSFLRRGQTVSVSARVLAELTRLLGADYVQVGSFSPRTYDSDEDVREQIAAVRPATAVIGGGVGAENAAEQIARAGTSDGVMLLLGSAAYAHPDGLRAGVAAAVEAVRG
ncbi:MAG TPA: RuBisCO large subunit C-terminal-like domain-containing protein [Gaiellaceae bacterium]|nr:RuBisCO large subunit C-terminal-like domain-containing protein [Gaiellaceae bacterium]